MPAPHFAVCAAGLLLRGPYFFLLVSPMYIQRDQNCISIYGAGAFSAEHTFECGQCFRWNRNPDGSYTGVAFSTAARISGDDSVIRVYSSAPDSDVIWRDYLDLDRDYESISRGFFTDEFTRAAVNYGAGLRILRQQPWEALCSFILSQCNNMARIKGIVSRLCRTFGEPIGDFDSNACYDFPTPERLSRLNADELAPLGAGYRAGYILSAARDIACGNLSLDGLSQMPTGSARDRVMRLPGVGRKVADCFLLFGLGRMDAFPVDTWIKKASVHYPGGLDPQAFGEYAGIAQQYIFYYTRSNRL